jgi:hypothetical protein
LTIYTRVLCVGALTGLVIGGRAYVVRHGLPFAESRARSLEPGATVPHMDHTPRHGGLVLMKGDTHLEVVLKSNGSCEAYFTDAVRMELPASFASEVTLGLASLKQKRQEVPLTIDTSGKAWVGRLQTIDDSDAIVRVAYVARGEAPYWIDVPLSAWQNVGSSTTSVRR